MTVCKRVYYTGRVQGVGFRYTTRNLAEGYAVTGYVRNLSNGQVELVAEGPAAQVEAFLAAVGQRMGDYIERTTVQDEAPENHSGFHIRY